MWHDQRGFTIVELIVVIVVIGILSTLAATRLLGRENIAAPAFAQQARAMIRYGQKLAVAQNRPVFVAVTSSRVALCYDSGCAAAVAAPGGGNTGSATTLAACGGTGWYCEGVPSGVTLDSPTTLMFFDEQGRPFAGTDIQGSDISTFSVTTIAVTGAAGSENVIVEPETGYVH